ncbi:reverse transcriptase domain-containing protein, partial [Tanacetum coccineum]
MSTRSSARSLLSPIEDPEKLISRRNRSEPSLLFDLEEDDMAGQAPPQGPIPDLRSMEELLQAPTDGVRDTTNLRNEITRFQQRSGETFAEAWDRFKDLLNKYPHHGFSPLHQIKTFYNSLSQANQDSLNSAAGVASASRSSTQDAYISSLTKQVEALLALHRPVDSAQNGVNSVQNGCETCGGPHPYFECQATGGYTQDGVLPSNTVPNPREDLKAITTRSGVTLAGSSVPPPPPLSSSKEVDREPETITNPILTESTTSVPPPVVQPSPASTELLQAPVSSPVIPEPNPHQTLIPYPSRLNKEKLQ